MKSIALTIVMIALLGLLVYTNPTLESYENFVRQWLIQEMKKEGSSDLERTIGSFLSGIASGVLARQAIRKDYLLLSTYDTDLGNEHIKAVGILNNFIVLEAPAVLKT